MRLVLHSDVCTMTEEYILTDILIMRSCDVYIGGVIHVMQSCDVKVVDKPTRLRLCTNTETAMLSSRCCQISL